MSQFCVTATGYIKEHSGLCVQVPSDTEEELAETGNTDESRFPSLWKHPHGLCGYSAVAACLPPGSVKLEKLRLPCIKLGKLSL